MTLTDSKLEGNDLRGFHYESQNGEWSYKVTKETGLVFICIVKLQTLENNTRNHQRIACCQLIAKIID